MTRVPPNWKYAKSHEWVRVDGNVAIVGITECAQEALGELEAVELPTKGKQLTQGEPMATLESAKEACDVLAPVSGTVFEVNVALEESPERVGRSPFANGWLCRLRPFDPSGLDTLMTAKQYEEYIRPAPGDVA